MVVSDLYNKRIPPFFQAQEQILRIDDKVECAKGSLCIGLRGEESEESVDIC